MDINCEFDDENNYALDYSKNAKKSSHIIDMILKKYRGTVTNTLIIALAKDIGIKRNFNKKIKEFSRIKIEDIIFYLFSISKTKTDYLVFTKEGILFTKTGVFLEYQAIDKIDCSYNATTKELKISKNIFEIKFKEDFYATDIINIIAELKQIDNNKFIDKYHPLLGEDIETRKLYLLALANLITIDDVIYASEINELYNLAKYIELTNEDFIRITKQSYPSKEENINDLLDTIKSLFYKDEIKYNFIVDLILIAFADKEIVIKESELIMKIAKLLSIDSKILTEMLGKGSLVTKFA